MRKGGPETAPRFLECCSVECTFACQRQPTDHFLPLSERPCLEEMVSDLRGAFVGGTGIDQLDRPGDSRVQSLLARAEMPASSV